LQGAAVCGKKPHDDATKEVRMPAISRILVPVDFSPHARAALDYAVELAATTNAAVDVLHVAEPTAYAGPEAVAMLPDATRGAFVAERGEVRRELEGFVGATRPRVRDVRIETGLPGDVIPAVAKAGEYDLVVMGTHGRGGLARLVVGSVAEVVMRRATIPVLTVKLPRREPRERVPL
jgi:nucleotide-binding universal stress UspA family protein